MQFTWLCASVGQLCGIQMFSSKWRGCMCQVFCDVLLDCSCYHASIERADMYSYTVYIDMFDVRWNMNSHFLFFSLPVWALLAVDPLFCLRLLLLF